MSRRSAEQAAQRLLRKYAISAVPVPVEHVAELEGAEVIRRRFKGSQSGFVYRDGDRAIIGVNSSTSRRRQRFTLAHELGHMLLHESDALTVDRAVQFRDGVSALGIDTREIEANAFAAALLMPQDAVIQDARMLVDAQGPMPRERLVGQLANSFDVSTEAMGYRLINLGVLSS